MPKKVVDHTVTVHRDGKNVTVEPNTVFDFTDEELADIEKVQPESTRDPKNEDPDALLPKAKAKGKAAEGKAEVKNEPEGDSL